MKQDGHVSSSCSARSATGKRAGGAGWGGVLHTSSWTLVGTLQGRQRWEACSFVQSSVHRSTLTFQVFFARHWAEWIER